MTSYVIPKKGFPFICYVGLVSQSTGQFQSNPTLTAGDFKLSKDGAALNNLATLPTVTPASSKSVKIALDSDETNADNLVIIGSDAAGAEWDDIFLNIQTTVNQIDDLMLASSYTAPANASIAAIKAQTDKISFDSDNYIYSHPNTPITVTTNNDKTGYSLTSAYDPAKTTSQDSDMAVVLSKTNQLTFDSDSYVLSHPSTPITITTNNDKTGYSLTSAYDPAKTTAQDSDLDDARADITLVKAKTDLLNFDSDNFVSSHVMNNVTVGTNNDKLNYTLTSDYDASKTSAQDSDMFDVLSYVSHLTFDSDDKVFANAAVSLTSDDIDRIVQAIDFPTADENATTLLKYDLSTITGEADRSPINALRKLRNKVSFSGVLSVKKEDDVTNAYTQSVTQDSDQEPFKSIG